MCLLILHCDFDMQDGTFVMTAFFMVSAAVDGYWIAAGGMGGEAHRTWLACQQI